MAETKSKTTTGTAAPPPPAASTETPKRTRMGFSKEKKIAYMLLSVLSILASKAIVAVLTEEQKAQIAKANKAAEAIGAEDPFKAVNDRVAAIQKELVALQAKFPKDATNNAAMTAYVNQAKELTLELDRQIKRKAQISELLGK